MHALPTSVRTVIFKHLMNLYVISGKRTMLIWKKPLFKFDSKDAWFTFIIPFTSTPRIKCNY